jgi:rhamnose transport system substrate-binding protein
MTMDRRGFIKTTAALAGAAAIPAAFARTARADEIRVGLVAKSLGNGFFVAVDKGAEEAAAKIGGVKVIFTGPTTTTAEGQIEVIQSLIDQHVDAIAISANDPDALVPICKRAMARGIKVMSYDSAVADAGRIVHLAPSSDELIGEALDKLAAASVPDGKGQIALVSATPTSTNQNAWIAVMKQHLSEYPGLDLVATTYGNDLADDSYREATALLQKYPDLKCIVSPSSVGIVASAKAVEDAKKVGQVTVTGLGLPSECAGHVMAGSIKEFAIWNPIDLGYSVLYVAVDLVKGMKGPGSSLPCGRMGSIAFNAEGVGAMAVPFTYDKSNVEQFAKVF